MAEKGKSMWQQFFRNAGIPPVYDTKYALIFDENRIKMDMLMDLNKECLKDMGIKAMGDIIAILKHAKIVHEEKKEQDFDPAKTSTKQTSPVAPVVHRALTGLEDVPAISRVTETGTKHIASSPPTGNKMSLSERFGASLKTSTASTSKSTPTPVTVSNRSSPGPKESKIAKNMPTSTAVRDSSQTSSTSSRQPPSKPTAPAKRIIITRNNSSSDDSDNGSPTHREEVPLQKKIRVLPEHEGGYKIKMPEGTISRTKQLLGNRLGPKADTEPAATKKTIFDRLGDPKVSSTSKIGVSEAIESKIQVSESASKSSTLLVSNSRDKRLSVFDRLGGRGSPPVGSTTTTNVKAEVDRPADRNRIGEVSPRPRIRARSPYDAKNSYASRSSSPYKDSRPSSKFDEMSRDRVSRQFTQPIQQKSEIATSSGYARSQLRANLDAKLDRPSSSSDRSTLRDRSYSPPRSRVSKAQVLSVSDFGRNAGVVLNAAKDGQVLKTVRTPSTTKGKTIVKRTILKRVSKSSLIGAATSSRSRFPDKYSD